MSLLIPKTTTNLSTANAFWRVETWNLLPSSLTNLSLNSIRTINVTFANAGNCTGLGLMLHTASYLPIDKGLNIQLEQIMGTCTFTAASPGVVNFASHGLADLTLVEFTNSGGALPAAVVVGVQYYVRNSALNSFNISATPTGSLINFATAGTGTQTLYAVRTNDSYTYSQIINYSGVAEYYWEGLSPSFDFATPYAVDTNANKWRFRITHFGGTTGTWSIETSDGTNPCYWAWCNNQLSFSNNDALIWRYPVNVDSATTVFDGVASTGITTACCGVMGRHSAGPERANVCNMLIDSSTARSITFKGKVFMGAWSGLRFGTSASPFTITNPLTITWSNPTTGTGTGYTGWRDGAGSSRLGRVTNEYWGEYPTIVTTELASQANTGQPTLVIVDNVVGAGTSKDWKIGDIICVGKQTTAATGYGDQTQYVIQNLLWTVGVGTTITLTGNVTGSNREVGASVINISRRGIWETSTVTVTNTITTPNNFVRSGVREGSTSFTVATNLFSSSPTQLVIEPSGFTSEWMIDHCSSQGATTGYTFGLNDVNVDGISITNNVSGCASFWSSRIPTIFSNSGDIMCHDNTFLSQRNAITAIMALPPNGVSTSFYNNRFENSDGYVHLQGITPTFTNNRYWGLTEVRLGTIISATNWSGNLLDKMTVGYDLVSSVIIGSKATDEVFGSLTANTKDIGFGTGGNYFPDFIIASPTGVINFDKTYLSQSVTGSRLGVTDENNVANVDYNLTPYGNITRTGDGLTDTTVWDSGTGKFAMRFDSSSGTNKLVRDIKISAPSDLAGEKRDFGIHVQICKKAYWDWLYELPRLTILVDGVVFGYSIAQQVASDTAGETLDGWRYLTVPVSFTTAPKSIIMRLSSMTNATGANACVYWDKWSGGNLVNTGMDVWEDALPVDPAYSFLQETKDILNASTIIDYGPDTIGESIKEKPLKVLPSGIVINS